MARSSLLGNSTSPAVYLPFIANPHVGTPVTT